MFSPNNESIPHSIVKMLNHSLQNKNAGMLPALLLCLVGQFVSQSDANLHTIDEACMLMVTAESAHRIDDLVHAIELIVALIQKGQNRVKIPET